MKSTKSFDVRAMVIIAVAAVLMACAGKGKDNDMHLIRI
jgi:hypothetical protein